MGLFNKIFKKDQLEYVVYAPVNGDVIELENVPDPTFSQGILGPGCGIEPLEGVIYAPFDGVITNVAETKHAIGITSHSGIELLIHVGVDTVDMKGEGFEVHVSENQKVICGDKILTFDRKSIQEKGHPDVVVVLLTNGDDFGALSFADEKSTEKGNILFVVDEKLN